MLSTALDRFRTWASAGHEGSYGEWECDYEYWDEIYGAIETAISVFPPRAAPEDILYALARDNETEHIRGQLTLHPEVLLWAASAAQASSEPDARWQVAVSLAEVGGTEALDLLRQFLGDSHEYVRRRALMAYAKHRPVEAEPLAWDWISSSEPYSRLAALHVLRDIHSPRFIAALSRLRDDEFDVIRARVTEFESAPGHANGSTSKPVDSTP